jgi:ssDNA-binding Zn-finger/Zn-ribbon topoisomerase 1
MKIGDIYPENTTVKTTEFTKGFIIAQAKERRMTPAGFCRDLLENLSRSKNGLVDTILDMGHNKEALENEIQEETDKQIKERNFFDFKEEEEEEKKKEKKKGTRKKNYSVIHHMRLPDRSELLTHNLRAFMRDWCKENRVVNWKRVFESAKTGFKNEKVTKTQRAFRRSYPYIKFKLVKDAKGEFRRFKKGQTSHARVVDLEEYEKKLKATTTITTTTTPKKKSIGLKKVKFESIIDAEDKCPRCKDGRRVLRDGPQGEFYGCSNFPKCRFTICKEEVDSNKVTKALLQEEIQKEESWQDKWNNMTEDEKRKYRSRSFS